MKYVSLPSDISSISFLVVDDDVVVTEGQMNVVVDGKYAAKFFNVKRQPDDVLLQFFRQVLFGRVDENSKLLGEDFYTSGTANEGAWRARMDLRSCTVQFNLMGRDLGLDLLMKVPEADLLVGQRIALERPRLQS